jgi:pimeloyl-ACP methyl ester carboxylesterase
MGGRISLEVALRAPERVSSLALLCPAVAFVKRDMWPLIKLLRPELGLLPHGFRRSMVARQLWGLFADSDAIDPQVADVVVDEFQRVYASPAARAAFLTSARNIYLEAPFGPNGFYDRLSDLRPPALFVWGSHDALIPAGFKRHVTSALPSAEQIVLQGCGHVPQVERPEQINGLILRLLRRADAFSPPVAVRRAA